VFIEDGDWEVIGNVQPLSNIRFPEYIIDTLSGTKVIDHFGKIIREATEIDKKELNTKKTVSPKVLEKAVEAKYGVGEWYPALEMLMYKGSK